MDIRALLGFDVGDLVRITRRKHQFHPEWDVVSCDVRFRKFTLQRTMYDGRIVQSTVSPRHMLIVKMVEERVAEALMEKPQ